jgi:hypothetical protein
LRIKASKENKVTRTRETLEKMASPKEWFSRLGDPIEVETPFTKRAKELVELYSGLCMSLMLITHAIEYTSIVSSSSDAVVVIS